MTRYDGDLKVGMRVELWNEHHYHYHHNDTGAYDEELEDTGTVVSVDEDGMSAGIKRDDGTDGAGDNNDWLIDRNSSIDTWGSDGDNGFIKIIYKPLNNITNWKEVMGD